MPEDEVTPLLLVEYQCCQQSAQHHDTLLWQVTYIVWGVNVLLLGFTLGAIDKPSAQSQVIAAALLGMVLISVVCYLARLNNAVMRYKYWICQRIEHRLRMPYKQHSRMRRWYPHGIQRRLYTWLTLLFLIVWGIILLPSTFHLWLQARHLLLNLRSQ